ncbi:MAG TPA: hypothetical protein ENN67_02925 [Firmicutes bacterium]|nr:hypothetical protein [Bacillota bacterium]
MSDIRRDDSAEYPPPIAIIGAVVPVFFFLFFINHRYFTDGLTSAYEIETNSNWVIHPNHPLFPLLPQIIHRITPIASDYPGLDLLNIWTGIMAVVAAWSLLILFSIARLKPATALISLGLYCFSAGIWYFSSTANQYSTALALNILTMLALVRIIIRPAPPTLRDSIMVGFLAVFAILSHQVNGLLLVPILFAFLSKKYRTEPNPSVAVFSMIFPILIAALTIILMGIALVGLRSPVDFIAWQKSYVTHPWYWAQSVPDSLQRTFKGATELHITHIFHSYGLFGNWNGTVKPLHIFTVIAQAFVLLFIVIETVRAIIEWFRCKDKPLIQTLGLTAWIPFMIFCFFFTPESVNYRIFYMPGFILFLAFALEKHYSLDSFQLRRALPLLLMVAALFLNNFALKFFPEHIKDNNPMLYEAVRLARVFGPDDIIVYSGAGEDFLKAKYALYFTGADAIILPDLIEKIRENPDEVTEHFNALLDSGGLVIIHEDALYSDENLEFLNRFYRMDIGRDELAEFLDRYAKSSEVLIINEKRFFILESANESAELPSSD